MSQFWIQHILRRGDDLSAIPAGKTFDGAKRMACKMAKEKRWPYLVITLLPTGGTQTLFEAAAPRT